MKIEHIAMYVNDLEAAKEFFIKYFDAVSNEMYHNQRTGFKSYFLSFEEGARLEIMTKEVMTSKMKEDGYEVISGPRTTGDGYYESCIVAVEDNQIEITV